MNPLVVSVFVFLILTMCGIAIYAAATSGRDLMEARLSQVALRARKAPTTRHRAPAVRRAGSAGGMRGGGARPARGDQGRRPRDRVAKPGHRTRIYAGLGRGQRGSFVGTGAALAR